MAKDSKGHGSEKRTYAKAAPRPRVVPAVKTTPRVVPAMKTRPRVAMSLGPKKPRVAATLGNKKPFRVEGPKRPRS